MEFVHVESGLDRTVCVWVTCLGPGVHLDRVMFGFQLVLLCLVFTGLKLNDRWKLSGGSVKGPVLSDV